jgi:hypothetical protein
LWLGREKACCPVGRLLVRAESGMACHSRRQQRLRRPATRTKAIGWHQMSAVCTESATDPHAVQTEARRAHALMINRRTGRGARTRQPEGASQRATEDRLLVSRRACVFAPTRRGKAPARAPPGEGPTQRLHVLKGVTSGEQGCSRSRINQVVWDVRQGLFRPFFFSVRLFDCSRSRINQVVWDVRPKGLFAPFFFR